MGIDMKKLILTLVLLLVPGLSFAGSQQIRNVVGMAKAQSASPIFYESFDTNPGKDQTWTTFSADPDYATSPAPLVGTESASLDYLETATRVQAWTGTYNVDFLMHIDAMENTGDSELLIFRDSGAVVIARMYLTADDKLKPRQGATTGTAGAVISVAQTYHVWLEYAPSTSSNGRFSIWMTVYTGSETKPGTVYAEVANGGSAAVPYDFRFSQSVETNGNITLDEGRVW